MAHNVSSKMDRRSWAAASVAAVCHGHDGGSGGSGGDGAEFGLLGACPWIEPRLCSPYWHQLYPIDGKINCHFELVAMQNRIGV